MIRYSHIAIAMVFLCLLPVSAAAKKKSGPVPVAVAPVEAFAPSTTIELPGTVLPWAVTRLAAEVDGRIDHILVAEGQSVQKDDELVVMRTIPLELELDLARAEHQRVANQLEELRVGTRMEVVEAARYNLEQAAARLELAESELKRADQLYKEGVISLDDFEKRRSEGEAARALHQEKQENYKEAVAGPRIERIKQEEANLAAAQARMDLIADQIDRATLRAPFDGIIVKKETEVGEWLEKGDPALSMIASYPVKVEVNLPQYHFDKIRVGTPASVILENRDGGKNRNYKGRVIEKVASGSADSRTFPVRIRIEASGKKVPVGMLVRVELNPTSSNKKLVFVPKDALVRSPKETAVWLIKKSKGKVKNVSKVLVTTGTEAKHHVAVEFAKNQIKAGDLVVIQGNERLKPNSQVTIITK